MDELESIIIMSSVLMSIKPEFVQKILSGEKVFEFRKRPCKRNVNRIYIYSTVPVKRVVAEAEVESIIIEEPETLWELTQVGAGIDKDFFDVYYKDRNEAVAYKLVNVKVYETPKTLYEMGIMVAPQSYRYIE